MLKFNAKVITKKQLEDGFFCGPQPSLRSEDYGKHLLSVDDLLEKHLLLEAQVNALGTRVRNLNKRAAPYMKSLHPESQLLQKRTEVLNKDYDK